MATHLVLNVGDRVTACGLRDPKHNRPAVPYLLARYVTQYERTSPGAVAWCPTCHAVAFGSAPDAPPGLLRLFD